MAPPRRNSSRYVLKASIYLGYLWPSIRLIFFFRTLFTLPLFFNWILNYIPLVGAKSLTGHNFSRNLRGFDITNNSGGRRLKVASLD